MQVPGELSETWSSDFGEGDLESLSCHVDLLVFLLNHSEMLQTSIQDGEANSTPLQYSCLASPMDGGVWWAAVHGVTKSRTRLSDFTFTFHSHALEKEMASHSSVLAWSIPGMGEPDGLPSMGSHRVGHDWSDLATTAAAASRNNKIKSGWQSPLFFFFNFFIFTVFWLYQVLLAFSHGFSLVAMCGLLLQWLLLWSYGAQAVGMRASVVVNTWA